MSTFKHPVGPQSGNVYWRRRLVVGLVLLAVVVVVVLIIVRPGSSSGTPKPQAATVASHTPVPTPTVPSTTIPTSAATVDGAPCKPANIKVEALTNADTYAAGVLPQLSLALTNTGTTSCTINAGTSQQVYTITSGSEKYWVSTDCQTKPVNTTILLAPGKRLTSTPIAWDRTRSDPTTCTSTRDPVPAGGASYHLETSLGGITSAETKQFALN